MIERVRVIVLAVALVGLLPAGAAVARWSSVTGMYPSSVMPAPATSAERVDAGAADSLAVSVTRRAPFRRSRRPAGASYDPVPQLSGSEAEPRAPRPVIVLAGFALGGRPLAVLEGLPGLDGPVVLAEGDTAGGLRVRRVRASGVLVTGYDTSWTLPLKEPWR